jgi:hypothetical protein
MYQISGRLDIRFDNPAGYWILQMTEYSVNKFVNLIEFESIWLILSQFD